MHMHEWLHESCMPPKNYHGKYVNDSCEMYIERDRESSTRLIDGNANADGPKPSSCAGLRIQLHPKIVVIMCPPGPMDKAPAYGAGDSRFDPGGGYHMCIFVKWIICFVNTAMFSCVFCQCHRRSSWSSHAKSMHFYHHQDTISWKIHILMNPIVVILRLDSAEVQLTSANQGRTLGHEQSHFFETHFLKQTCFKRTFSAKIYFLGQKFQTLRFPILQVGCWVDYDLVRL